MQWPPKPGSAPADAIEYRPVGYSGYIPDISNLREIPSCQTPRRTFATGKWMECKMVKLGRVYRETPGAILPPMIEDLVVRNHRINRSIGHDSSRGELVRL